MSESLIRLQQDIATLIVETLNLEDVDSSSIDNDAALFGDGLGLDSIDALEIGAAISKKYHIKLKSQSEENQKHFSSITALAKFVANHSDAATGTDEQ